MMLAFHHSAEGRDHREEEIIDGQSPKLESENPVIFLRVKDGSQITALPRGSGDFEVFEVNTIVKGHPTEKVTPGAKYPSFYVMQCPFAYLHPLPTAPRPPKLVTR
jgi:hypothetical protein